MTPEARSTLLAARYPEFEYLVREFQDLQPRLVTLEKAAHGKSGKSLEAVRYWILGCYEVVGPDGKRSINYTIEKNKGLAPKRKKENRNPRVKKKLQYEAKQKKLRSMMSTYKGGEPQGGYGGEKTGITTGLVRARKL
ncbi:hypothetical protein VdG1_08081 [Verticillium dahliae VDG1]|nr:hypothetical protein VdG1_08081 [Verticillium dahliae VDG1]